MLSSTLFLASCAILFFVLKFRAHVHVTYTPPRSPARRAKMGRRAEAGPKPPRPTAITRPTFSTGPGRRAERFDDRVTSTATTRPGQSERAEIASALVNLGAKAHRAKAAADHVCRNWPEADFDTRLKEALREVAA